MELEQLKKEIEELKNWKKSLESSYSIPLNIDQAFRARFFNTSDLSVSAKGADTEDQVAGNATNDGSVTVLDDPQLFLEITIGTTVYYIPAYTSLT